MPELRPALPRVVWAEHWFGSTRTLDVHVAALRRKLREATQQGRVPDIVTVRGHGYLLQVPAG